jgi:hypothetical protein
MLPTCAFFCQCSWSICFVPNFWISSRVVQWKCCPSFSLLSSSSSPLSCSHRVLLPLFRGFSPVYITEHIQKYCSIENFIKLPFQRVLINLNRSPNEGAMAVLFPLLHPVQKFQNVEPSVIRPYPLVGTSDWLDSWFVGSITLWAYKYPKISYCSPLRLSRNWWEQKLLVNDPNMLTTLILWSSGRYNASPLALSPHHCWTSE